DAEILRRREVHIRDARRDERAARCVAVAIREARVVGNQTKGTAAAKGVLQTVGTLAPERFRSMIHIVRVHARCVGTATAAERQVAGATAVLTRATAREGENRAHLPSARQGFEHG